MDPLIENPPSTETISLSGAIPRSSIFTYFKNLFTPHSIPKSSLLPLPIEEKAAFIAAFAAVRFDNLAVEDLVNSPLPWPSLESQFQHSGSEKSPASRKRFIEWQFSSTEDCTEWLDKVPHHLTFPTRSFPLSLLDAKALIAAYRNRVLNGRKLSDQEVQTLNRFAKFIEKQMKTHPSETGKYFIRLNPRSPKDAVLYPGIPQYTLLLDQVRRAAIQIKASIDPEMVKEHKRQAALASLSVRALAITKASEAIDLFTNSERTYRDLNQALEFPKLWDMQVILRDFHPIPYHNEFRAFVYNGKLTAISQYDHRIYFSELNEKGAAEKIQIKLTTFFYENIAKELGKRSYIIDFGITEDGTPKVIELNPFEPGTGPALFSWEKELQTLQGRSTELGDLPSMRIVTSYEVPPPIFFPEWEETLHP